MFTAPVVLLSTLVSERSVSPLGAGWAELRVKHVAPRNAPYGAQRPTCRMVAFCRWIRVALRDCCGCSAKEGA